MFRGFAKRFLPNRLDWMLKRLSKRKGKKVLLGWNRGLGDIPLGLYALVQRIRELVPNAEVTVVTRHNLYDGFSLLEGVKVLIDPKWVRGEPHSIDPDLKRAYDLVLEHPSPNDWVYWQRGKVVPKLKWEKRYDTLYERFDLPASCIGMQVSTETSYGLWRNWPQEKWEELLQKLTQPVLLFGFGDTPKFSHPHVIDLRGKTTLFELLSIIKHRVRALVVPDSGISSMVYYLDTPFSLRHITLWADPDHGILKQAVPSPNPELVHIPLIAEDRNLAHLSVDRVLAALEKKTLPILLAAGQGTRLGINGPKGLLEIAGKTLFQWICEKLPKGSPLAIMTSPLNHEATVRYFEEQQFFGLDVHFFQQEMLPLLDAEKQPTAQMGPNGNGNVFQAFVKAKLDQVFQKRGIECVTISYIDNPLSHPLDPKLIGPNAKITVQCIPREKEDKSMGVLVKNAGKWNIVEYMHLDPMQEYPYAYSGQLAFDFSFFCEMGHVALPLHEVAKTIDGKKVWKQEQFIFDVFPYASHTHLLCVDRKTHYAPIKDRESMKQVLAQLGATCK